MGFFYFDESIHPRGSFTLGAFAYSEESLDLPVSDALRQNGLIPGMHEFKSGTRMDKNPVQAKVRDMLKSVINSHCRIGLVVAPDSPRQLLGHEAVLGLEKILSMNDFETPVHEAFFDQGIFETLPCAHEQAAQMSSSSKAACNFHFEQNSREVMGLQVADLIAHMCATMLLAQLGLITKKVKVGENSGYDTDLDVELEFELWATLRWKFFALGPPPYDTWKSQLDFQADVASSGLHVAARCDPGVRDAALNCFGRMYLGCIH